MTAVLCAGPGAGIAYVTPASLVLLQSDAPDRELLATLIAATDWAEILSLLVDRVDAAVAHASDGALQLAAIGACRATTTNGGHDDTVVAGPSGWATASFVDAGEVRLDLTSVKPPVDLAEFVISTGAAPASSVRRTYEAHAPGERSFDALFGATLPREVEAAALRDAAANCSTVLIGSDGRRIVLDRPVLIGRNPDVVRDDERDARLVRIADPAVSRRHALVRLDRWAATVDDLGSTNGTTLSLPGGPSTRVAPGSPEGLTTGAIIDLGGAVSFVVEAGA